MTPVPVFFVSRALAVCASVIGLTAACLAQGGGPTPAGMTVTVTKTTRGCFADIIQASGFLVPREEILVRPDVEGMQVTQIIVEDGDRVTSGQVLARLARPEGQGQGTGTVRSPAAGIVNFRFVRIGMMASARADPLFRIVANGDIELLGDVPATRIAKLASGQVARIEIPGVGEVSGRVRFVSPQINSNTQLGRVQVSIDNDDKLRVGAYARAIIEVGRSCGATIPLSAVLYGPEGAVVQVVREDRIETRRVRVGLLSGGKAEIREGLGEGDLVVARAGTFLREGDRVRPMLVEQAPSSTTR
jgi:multidrug efflux pump subunit AcrA (membrane-fusion protein)